MPKLTDSKKSAAPKAPPKVTQMFPAKEGAKAAHPAGKGKEDPTEPNPSKGKSAPKKRPIARPAAPGKQFKPDFSRLKPLDDLSDHLRIVLYGDQGVGKTTSVASLSNRGKLVVVDTEQSFRKKALTKRDVDLDNILVWPEWETYDDLQQFYVTIKQELADSPGSIFAVAVDTASALAHYWLEAAVTDALGRPAMQKKHPDRTKWETFQEDYGTLTDQFRTFFPRQLFTLPCHVVVTAHARRSDNESGQIKVGPSLPPASQQALMVYADWVLRLQREEKNGEEIRTYTTRAKGIIEAKDRFGALDSVETNKSLLDLIAKWETDG